MQGIYYIKNLINDKINIGRFEDFISPTIIYDLIEEALEWHLVKPIFL